MALGNWATRQRRLYKNGELLEERRRRLKDVQFVWVVTTNDEAGWKEKFKELVHYKEREGDCYVPQRYSASPPLGKWAKKQRQNYKNGKLSQDGRKSMYLWYVLTLGQFLVRWTTQKLTPG